MRTILLFIAAIMLTACHSISYNTQVEDTAYLQFTGDMLNTKVQIDEHTFELNSETELFELNGKMVAKFPISIGKHQLTVHKMGKVIINKHIFATEGQTVEVNIP